MTRDKDQKSKEVPYMEVSRDTDAYKSSNFHFSKSLFNFHSQKNSLLSATSILSRSPMVYNTTETLDKLVCTTMWTLARVKTDLDASPGPKMTPTIWILN